ncbi:3-keto-5-aminohexanoate cleavage protein [Mesorhizobium sp. M00.F.Ca.ET.186.01.1.1]|nr:3-keto-5-aminohexanoate cleavage protein [bacterium M00.F.Ca.ET.205.01.1.1]TGU50373.1 3-keto-5-aminohexanoate cleavage protein [bacterium M00.F.Ca.ET.152.01.1.1]TGV33848.1 3-keto-5-aminohexanoate cleavage protein [Mesorhizobium sp. M00.F.Ca.ET.186.01.1.1]TGZ40737.1 3-keto-5-aminohexanoate cleavage protein [bacterium M00.F.Ca.ET.162.01.1.1]
MIVQACINGARPRDFHPLLPLTVAAMAGDAAACVAAGAAELHIHPRGADGRESLGAVDATMLAVRQACPGTLIGVSTGAWIENDEARTRAAIAAWRELPDYASVNLSEADAPAVMELLRQRGVGIEAGLVTIADSERFVALAGHDRVLRILVEIDIPDLSPAVDEAHGIAAVLERAGVRRSILLHGVDLTVWPFVELARQRRWSTRVGLEDGRTLADGTIAKDNAAIVAAAVAMFRGPPAG